MKTIILYAIVIAFTILITACGSKSETNIDAENHQHSDVHNHDEHDHENEGHDHGHEVSTASNDITVFTPEQAKNILDFKVEKVQKQTFYQILKTSGQILSAPGDEALIAATMSGIITISNSKLVEGVQVNSGQQLFSISGRNLSENNPMTRINEAKAIFENAKVEFERAQELVSEKIISEKDFLQAKLAYEQARLSYQTYAAGMSGSGKSITTPITGYVKNLLVQTGQYVEIGQALATITQNRRLILRADVSQRYIPHIKNVKTASFTTPYDDVTYDLEELNGNLVSIGRNSGENSFFTPVNFEFDNKGNILEGTYVEVFLKSLPLTDALVLPITALIEEQGHFFVFVQLEHEGEYIKKEVQIGASDGTHRQILRGINEGQKVVTGGAYSLKLASMSGSMPEHDHAH